MPAIYTPKRKPGKPPSPSLAFFRGHGFSDKTARTLARHLDWQQLAKNPHALDTLKSMYGVKTGGPRCCIG